MGAAAWAVAVPEGGGARDRARARRAPGGATASPMPGAALEGADGAARRRERARDRKA